MVVFVNSCGTWFSRMNLMKCRKHGRQHIFMFYLCFICLSKHLFLSATLFCLAAYRYEISFN